MLATDFELNVDDLLSEISAELPCGEDLEYDAAFAELERAAEPKAEQQFGDTIIPGEGPEWKTVLRLAQELFSRTRDLRIAVYLTQASLAVHGLHAFAQSVRVVRGLIENHWEHVHPQLDPDDDNDPTMRVNTIATLCDSDSTLSLLRVAPIVAARSVGRFSYRDVLIAQGELSPPEDTEPPDMAVIGAAFQEIELDQLQAVASALDGLFEDVQQIESQVTERVGVGQACSLEPLRALIREIQQVYREQLTRRGVAVDGEETGDEDTSDENVARLSGQITSREDVVRALDKLTEYYHRHEPSSPLPLLLNRAKRLANADFLTIVRDLAPDGLDQAQAIGGASSNGGDGYESSD